MTAKPRMLVLKVSSMGDVLCALPAITALRRARPEARIDWLVDERFADLLRCCPSIDEVLLAKAPSVPLRGLAEHFVRSAIQYRIAGDLRRRKYDIVVDMQGLFRTGLLSRATGSRRRVGFADAREGARHFYSERVSAPAITACHAVERCFRLAEHLGASSLPTGPLLNVDPAVKQHSLSRWEELGGSVNEPFVLLAPFTSTLKKDWSVTSYRDLIDWLWRRHGCRCVLVGGSAERSALLELAYESLARPIVFTEGLLATMALMQQAALTVSNDSGPAHLAAMLDRPVVALYGPTDPNCYGPWRQLHHAIRSRTGRMEDLSVAEVQTIIDVVLLHPTNARPPLKVSA